MTEHFNQLTPAQDERLAKLSEECAEVIKAVSKIQRHGYESYNPDAIEKGSNKMRLEAEVADVYQAVNLLCDAFDINLFTINRLLSEQLSTPAPYMHHQGDEG